MILVHRLKLVHSSNKMMNVYFLVIMTFLVVPASSWKPTTTIGKSKWLKNAFSSMIAPFILCSNSNSVLATESITTTRLSNEDISKIVADDITIRQALITADFSSSIYNNDCKFQDEIDTYKYDQYVKGTKALFNAAKSHVDLVGPVVATDDKVEFKFKETLVFNIPFNPTVDISGHVELSRSKGDTGLITYSREFWDQPVGEVLTHVRFQ